MMSEELLAPLSDAGPLPPPMAPGTVMAQIPAAGDRVDPGMPIQLPVAK